jgi:hypothetical protein
MPDAVRPLWLLPLARQGGARRVALTGTGPWRIGRSPSNDAHVDHPAVSREHAVIEWGESAIGPSWRVIDQGSASGTWVNDVPLPSGNPMPIRPGDRVRFGPVAFEVTSRESCEETTDVTRCDPSPPVHAVDAAGIEARHLDHGARAVYVDGTKTKAAKRWIPCDADVWPVLTARAKAHPTGPLYPTEWQRGRICGDARVWALAVAKKRAEAAGDDPRDPKALERHRMAPWSTNDLRRTFASWLCQAGAPELEVTRLLGHTSSAMVRRVYAQMSGDALRRAIDRLPCRVTAGVTELGDIERTQRTQRTAFPAQTA